jgi:branched-chain amino acid transport system ATP-binding protein
LGALTVQAVFRVITSTREEGISVLLVERNVRAAAAIADRAYVLDDRKIVHSGEVAEFASDEERLRSLAGVSGKRWD